MSVPARITFILPGLCLKPMGGPKIIFGHANRLAEKGCDVTILFLAEKTLSSRGLPEFVRRLLCRTLRYCLPSWFTLHEKIKTRCIFGIDNASVCDGDRIIATGVQTARGVAGLDVSKGRPYYFIQDYENWETPDEEVRATYRLGMRNMAIAKWLVEFVRGEAKDSCAYIPNPIDTETFYRDSAIDKEPHTISVLFHKDAHKGFDDAWKAIREAKEVIPDIKVEMFGVTRPKFELPSWVTYTYRANDEQLRHIYNKASVHVCASLKEGFGLTSLEAMACGCVLVTTDFLGSREYAENENNALVSEVGDVSSLVSNIVYAMKNEASMEGVRRKAIERAKKITWETASDALICELGIEKF